LLGIGLGEAGGGALFSRWVENVFIERGFSGSCCKKSNKVAFLSQVLLDSGAIEIFMYKQDVTDIVTTLPEANMYR
jgi:hypothetical protein